MHNVSNTARPISYGEISWEDGDFGEPASMESRENLIQIANSIPIIKIFNHYKLKIDKYNNIITCPFHNNGNERTPSFHYYPHTNSFCCYGCRAGPYGVNFVSLKENLSFEDSAKKIIELFGNTDETELYNIIFIDSNEKLKVMMKFSNLIREIYHANPHEDTLKFLDQTCQVFDYIYDVYNFDCNIDGLKRTVDLLLDRVRNYISCQVML